MAMMQAAAICSCFHSQQKGSSAGGKNNKNVKGAITESLCTARPPGQPFVLNAVGAQIRVIYAFKSLLPQPCTNAPPLVDDCCGAPSAILIGAQWTFLMVLIGNLHCDLVDMRYYSCLFSSCRLSPLFRLCVWVEEGCGDGVLLKTAQTKTKTLLSFKNIYTKAKPSHLVFEINARARLKERH